MTKSHCRHCNSKIVHSFSVLEEEEVIDEQHIRFHHAWFYTAENKIVDRTPESIVDHIRNELTWYHKNQEGKSYPIWSWYYDAREFNMDVLAMDIFVRLLEVFVQFGSTLQQIRILPNDMMRGMLKMTQAVLPDWMRLMIILE